MYKNWKTALALVIGFLLVVPTGLQAHGFGRGRAGMGMRAAAGSGCGMCGSGMRRGGCGGGMGVRAGGRYNPAMRLDHLTTELGLTAEQKTKVDGILQDEQKQLTELRGQSSLSATDRRTKFWALRDTTRDRIRAALNADQQKKFDALHSRNSKRPQAAQ